MTAVDWFRHYPEGVPREVDLDKFTSLVDMVQHSCSQYGDHVALSNMGHKVTYRELDELSCQFAAYLQQVLKLKRGDRVAIMLPNLIQFPVAMMGILRAGLVVVNVNPLYTARELIHQLNDSGCETIIVLANFANVLEQALEKTGVKHVILTELGDMLGAVKKPLVNFVVRYIKKMVPAFQLPGAIHFVQALSLGRQHVFETVEIGHEDIAFLQYTGGTTGVSKGATLTHKNMLANVLQIVSWVGPTQPIPGQERVIVALPLYHIFSLTVCCFCFFCAGSECVLITNPRDLAGFVKTLAKKTFSFFVGLNTLFNHLADQPGFAQIDFSRLKLTVSGGMALQSAVAEKWHKLTGLPIVEGFGLTEASPVVTINPVTIKSFTGSIGVPISSTEACVMGADGQMLPPGVEGELCVRGPQVMRGYWNRPEATDNVLDKAGWLHTGDIARMDEAGYFYLVDRQKDMIVVSGFNVYPNEIEEVISTMAAVKEVAVIGVPSDKTGETVKAFIVKNEPKLTEDEIIAHCRSQLTAYKVPKLIEFRFDLPKSNVGKVLRRELRDEHLVPAES
jgi:long-chain acyl-CoA synthetase